MSEDIAQDEILFEGGALIGRVFTPDNRFVNRVFLDGVDVTDACSSFLGSQLAGHDRQGWVKLIKTRSDGGIFLASASGQPLIEHKEGIVKWERVRR